MIIAENVSFSRYEGIQGRSRYDAVDDYFRYEVDGNIICTDDDGNIILLTPEGDVAHIGKVPMLESGAGDPEFWLDDNKGLHVKYMIFCDNDHHHSGTEEKVIDCSFAKWKPQIERNKLIQFLSRELEAFGDGSYRNLYRISNYTDRDKIDINVRVIKYGYNYLTREEGCYTIRLEPVNGRYEITDNESAKYKDVRLFYGGEGTTPVQKALDKYKAYDNEKEDEEYDEPDR